MWVNPNKSKIESKSECNKPCDGGCGLLVVSGQEDDIQAHPLQGVHRQVGLGLHSIGDTKNCHQNSCKIESDNQFNFITSNNTL